MWFYATDGKGSKDMVILPYKDRLQHLARYMQQLVMESLGKKYDRNGEKVNQGISVYGNKGSTDQHAYLQQLIDGVNNFFVTFIEVLGAERKDNIYVNGNITSGDYLQAFLLGTKQALTEGGRETVTITIKHLDAFSLGVLIALFERAISIYASLININAYHQPGVELGKKGANMIIDMLAKVIDYLQQNSGETFSVEEIAAAIGNPEEEENIFKLLEYLSANSNRGVKKICGLEPFKSRYTL
jgi:glucose-6-phosphate isomerase